jgi:dolichol-phosphate mannosyltransferase
MREGSSYQETARNNWEVPSYDVPLWSGRKHDICIVIPVINENGRIKNLLNRMTRQNISDMADIIIVDGGSTDGSLDLLNLKHGNVRGLLVKTAAGKLGAQLRCAYSFALDQGYEGIVTIDGNDKDDPAAIFNFIAALKQGFDFVQGSRFIPGGIAENTPLIRDIAIRYIHAPLLRLFSGFQWTDTTQGFRAYSKKLLADSQVAPFREVFNSYELLSYLSCRAPRLGYRCIELPTSRRYPKGEVPTKISSVRGNLKILTVLIKTCCGAYNPDTN